MNKWILLLLAAVLALPAWAQDNQSNQYTIALIGGAGPSFSERTWTQTTVPTFGILATRYLSGRISLESGILRNQVHVRLEHYPYMCYDCPQHASEVVTMNQMPILWHLRLNRDRFTGPQFQVFGGLTLQWIRKMEGHFRFDPGSFKVMDTTPDEGMYHVYDDGMHYFSTGVSFGGSVSHNLGKSLHLGLRGVVDAFWINPSRYGVVYRSAALVQLGYRF